MISAGKSETECAYVDMMLENAMDLRNTVVGMVYNPEYVSALTFLSENKYHNVGERGGELREAGWKHE